MRSIKLVAVVAVLFAMGVGIAGADIPESDGRAYGCYLRRGNAPLPKGNLRVIDTDQSGHCTLKEGNLNWMAQAVFISDRAAKRGITPVDDRVVLSKLEALPVTSWEYKTDDIRHIGPMAQDFNKAFGVGPDPKHIAIVDGMGVSLAAIKGLDGRVRTQQREIEGLGVLLVLTLGALCYLSVRRRKPYRA